MKKVGIIMEKGGSGKSSVCRHLAVAADQAEVVTVVLDTDPQGTLRDWGEARGREPHVISEYGTNPDRIAQAVTRCETAGADLLLIDTQGHSSPISTNVARLCDLVLVPMRPTSDDFRGVRSTLAMLQDRNIPHFVVLCQVPTSSTRPRVEAEALLQKAGIPYWPGAIHTRNVVPDSSVGGESVFEMQGLRAYEAKAAEEFRGLFQWVAGHLALPIQRVAA